MDPSPSAELARQLVADVSGAPAEPAEPISGAAVVSAGGQEWIVVRAFAGGDWEVHEVSLDVDADRPVLLTPIAVTADGARYSLREPDRLSAFWIAIIDRDPFVLAELLSRYHRPGAAIEHVDADAPPETRRDASGTERTTFATISRGSTGDQRPLRRRWDATLDEAGLRWNVRDEPG